MMTDVKPMKAIDGHAPYFVYHGDRPQWFMMLAVTRDSDALERSNWRVIVADMDERFTLGQGVAIERMYHFACGWIDYLLVNPKIQDAIDAADDWRRALADYPVADDEDFSETEYADAYDAIATLVFDTRHVGHSDPPSELSEWDDYGDGYYTYTCTRCERYIELLQDGTYWRVPEECTGDEGNEVVCSE